MRRRRPPGARFDLAQSRPYRPAAAAIQIQALVELAAASAARSAASLKRPRVAASAAAMSSVVTRGSTTAEPEVNRKTGLRASRTTAITLCRLVGAIAYTQAR